MNTTKILGEAVGIQRQDIIDRTEEQTTDGLTGAVILGRFKRGRLDAPMEIHQGNIRGQLGYDPKNPDYIAVQDCLDTNVPSVQVLRLKSNISGSISLGISPDLQYVDDWTERKIRWAIEVNDTLYPTEIGIDDEYSYLEDYLQENKEMLGITGEYKSESNEGENNSSVYIQNITNTRKFIRLIPNAPYVINMKFIGNPTAKIDSDGVISFWLEANSEVTKPEPVCNCEQSWVLIPELTPATTFNENDEVFVSVKNFAQSSGMAYSNNKPIIEVIERMMTNSFPNHLELIRCDSEGTLLRNKTDDCLTLSIWGSNRNFGGDKEFISYLPETDLCAYDDSEVLPEPWPELGSPFTFISSGGEVKVVCESQEGTLNIAVDWGDGVLVKYPNHSSSRLNKTGIAELSVVKVYVDQPMNMLGVEGFVAITDWGDTPVKAFNLRDILLPEYTGRRVPDYLPTYVRSTSYMFGLTIFNDDISMWDVSRVTEMTSMFAECEYFNQPLDSWDVSKVTLFNAMFRSAKRFNQPLNSWNVSSTKNMEQMFDAATSFNQPLNNWNVSNVENMDGMFNNASPFNQDISKWCVSKITSEPNSFTDWMRGKLIEAYKPVWGTCQNG
ncbi:protein of unknown function, DUF285 [Acinetobacter bohemicus]|uniref:Surface protein n=1 Tax=Acinetobacter bohemicus TaxID=1435036 RepID=A0A1I6VEW6_9GAMM|nr:BspA family leucine-rich repeat surface protein [Acinetobacter bohemicus]SFT12283.1 protein of unknown function, DUF285 [Acinetobacter bohemicus]